MKQFTPRKGTETTSQKHIGLFLGKQFTPRKGTETKLVPSNRGTRKKQFTPRKGTETTSSELIQLCSSLKQFTPRKGTVTISRLSSFTGSRNNLYPARGR